MWPLTIAEGSLQSLYEMQDNALNRQETTATEVLQNKQLTKPYSIRDSKDKRQKICSIIQQTLSAARTISGSNIMIPYLQQSRVCNSIIPCLYIPAEQCALLQYPRSKHELSCHTKTKQALHWPVGENVQSRSFLYDLLSQPQNENDKKLCCRGGQHVDSTIPHYFTSNSLYFCFQSALYPTNTVNKQEKISYL